MQIQHQNVLKIFGVGRNNLFEAGNDQGERYFVVTEICENGETGEASKTGETGEIGETGKMG